MKKIIAIAALGLAPLLAGCFPCTTHGRAPIPTTTQPEVSCMALGCAGSPPDPVTGCADGLVVVDDVCRVG